MSTINRRKFSVIGIGLLILFVALGSLAAVLAQEDTFGHEEECVVYRADAADITEQEDGDTDEDEAEGEDVAITGDPLDRASAAALEYVGEGRVTGTEIGDEEGYYEIEVTRPNGQQIDVHLDEAFNVLGDEAEDINDDDETENDQEETEDIDDDNTESEDESCGLLEDAAMSLDEIIELAEKETGSTVVLIELENENNQMVYEAELASGAEIEFDAATGEILEIEEAD